MLLNKYRLTPLPVRGPKDTKSGMNNLKSHGGTNYPLLPQISARLLMILGVCLIFLPKITIIDLGLARAGIRIDDFIIALSALVGFLPIFERLALWLRLPTLREYLTFCGLAFLAVAVGEGHWIFPLRYFEYVVVILFGIAIGQKMNLVTVTKSFLIVNGVVAIGQYFGWVGGFAIRGYEMLDGARAMGVTNHPSELGLVVAMSFAFILGKIEGRGAARKAFLWLCIAMVSVGLSGSRVPLTIIIVAYVVWKLKYAKSASGAIFLGLVGILVGAGILAVWSMLPKDSPLGQRFEDTFAVDNLSAVGQAWDQVRMGIRSGAEATGEEVEEYARVGLDASLGARLINFGYVVGRVSAGGWAAIVLGLGPGSFGASTDMGYIRLLAETGLLGFATYVAFMVRAASISLSLFLVIIVFSLNMITLDAYQGYKIMLLLFIMVGSEIVRTGSGRRIFASGGQPQMPGAFRGKADFAFERTLDAG